MNENAKKWVEALRSGEYRQAKGALRVDDSFCCLGVACDISGLADWKPEGPIWADTYLGAEASLPTEVRAWLGLATEGAYYSTEGETRQLSHENDKGKSLPEIADIIESEPKGLFG